MDDFDDSLDNSEDEKKKKKGGKSESETAGRSAVVVGEGFYAYMASIGAPASKIAEVLKSWRHLRGDGLAKALADFVRNAISRATAHVQVEIDKDKDYGLIHNFIQHLKSLGQSPEQRHRFDNRNRFDPK